MTYSTKEIANYLGVPVNQMSVKLKRMGYEPCGASANNVYLWEVDSLETLKAKHNEYQKSNFKENITLQSLANKYEMSGSLIYRILKSKDIFPVIDNHKNPVYSRTVCEILDKIDRIDDSNHPLVTDKRCLSQNWWPDTKPICFEGIDDD